MSDSRWQEKDPKTAARQFPVRHYGLKHLLLVLDDIRACVESWGVGMAEHTREEWLLSFTADTDEKLFDERFRQSVVYVLGDGGVPHFVWFTEEREAKLARAFAEGEGVRDLKLQHRAVTTIATDWVDVP